MYRTEGAIAYPSKIKGIVGFNQQHAYPLESTGRKQAIRCDIPIFFQKKN